MSAPFVAGSAGEERRGRRRDWRLVPSALTVWASALLGLLWGWWAAVVCAVVAVVIAGVAVALVWRPEPRRGQRGRRGRRNHPAHRGLRIPARGWPAAGALLVCALASAGPMSARLYEAEHDPLRRSAARGGEVVLRATVSERPRPVRSVGYADRPGGVRSVLVPVDVDQAVVGARRVPSRGRMLLIAPSSSWSRVLPGQQVTTRADLAPPRPHELTVAVGFVRGPPEWTGAAPWWQRGAESLRAALRAVCEVLPDEPAGLLPGLVVGDTSALSPRVEQDFLDAGMSHLTAVSGSNVAILCGAVLLLARASRLGPRASAAVAGVALLGFVVLVGYEPSVLRAGVMGAVGLLALVLGRRGSALPALAAAVCVLVLADPAMATSMGFALSVVATAGLVLLAPRWAGALARRGVPAGVAQGLAVPAVAFLATAPVVAGLVGEVSAVSVVANVLAAPVVAPVTVLGALAAVLAPGWAPAAEFAVHLAGPCVRWLILVAREAAAVPGAVVPWPAGWWGGLLAAVTIVVFVVALRRRVARLGLAVVLAALLVLSVPVGVVFPAWPPDEWVLVACDVGQGDGLVLATGDAGRAVVVDVGPEPRALDRCLDRLDVERIPLVVLSHLHADHIGGLPSVFDGRAVGAIALGPGRSPAWAWRRVAREAEARRVPLLELRTGHRLAWPELRIEVLGPRYVPPGAGRPGDGRDGTEVNDSSVVLRAETPAGSILLTGDIELGAQSDLLASGAELRADILKIPHHGSRYTRPRFLAEVAARVAVVSVGADNSYGHPSPMTLRTLTANGTLVARTDTGGDTAIVLHEGDPAVVRRGPSIR